MQNIDAQILLAKMLGLINRVQDINVVMA